MGEGRKLHVHVSIIPTVAEVNGKIHSLVVLDIVKRL